MDANFWHAKWASQQIGFHESDTHPLLLKHWSDLNLDSSCRVFVPLCGKSLDMLWLRQRGHAIAGVELSAIALQAFFDEQTLPVEHHRHGALDLYRAAGYALFCGDIFALEADALGSFDAIYDRAALIALAPQQRRAYLQRLAALCTVGTRMLLITVAYDDPELRPPPFALSARDVSDLCGELWSCTTLSSAPAEVKGRPASETAWQLERKTRND